jgi:hypothetical protein
MKTLKISFGALLFAIGALAQQTKLSLPVFNNIILDGSQAYHLKQGDENAVLIDGMAPENNPLKAVVNNETLQISFDKKTQLTKSNTITIIFKNLSMLDTKGSLDVFGDNEFNLTDFKLASSGSSDIQINLKADKFSAEITGAGDVQLKGSANEAMFKIQGAGDVDAYDFICKNVTVNASGAGDAKVNCTGELTGNCTGAGSVKFKGNPTNVRITQTGAGTVSPSGNKDLEMNINISGLENLDALKNLDKLDDFDKMEKNDSTKIRIGKKKIIIIGDKELIGKESEKESVESNEYPDPEKKIQKNITIKKDKHHVKDIWKGFEVGVNGYLTAANKTAMPNDYGFLDLNYGKSIMMNLNFLEKHYKIIGEKLVFTTGLGIQFNRYSFVRTTQLKSTSDKVFYTDTQIDYTKNLLRVNYLTLPLMLEYNSRKNPHKSFHFAAGPILGYRIFAIKLKQEYEKEEKEVKDVYKKSFNINDFQYGVTARFGYGNINVFTTYNASTLFRSGKTLAVHPFSIGLTVVPF